MRLKDYEALLTVDPTEAPLRHDEVRGYRTRATYAGDMLDVDAYPILLMPRAKRDQLKGNVTSEAQAIVNQRYRLRKVTGLFDANFGQGDIFVTVTYAGDLPDYDQALKDMRKYVREIRKELKKQGKELNYIYALGYADDDNKKVRLHGHIIMTGMDRDKAERIWQEKVHAGRVNSRRVQPGDDGLKELARYFLNQHARGRGWNSSKNLTKPTEKSSDRKLSRRRVERMARQLDHSAKEIMEKLYPDYKLIEATVRRSEYMPGAYVYARMARRNASKQRWTEWRGRG